MDFLELFDAANLPYYDGGWSKCCTGHDCSLLSRFPGCLIVELLDYRPPKSSDAELENPDTSRVVLTPNDESRWADMCLLSQKASSPWTDSDAIEMEARILVGLQSLFYQSPYGVDATRPLHGHAPYLGRRLIAILIDFNEHVLIYYVFSWQRLRHYASNLTSTWRAWSTRPNACPRHPPPYHSNGKRRPSTRIPTKSRRTVA